MANMKRFYKSAQYTPYEGGYKITLDERDVKTPQGHILIATNENIANAICAEWNAQEEHIEPTSMAVTQYLYTALDYIPSQQQAIIDGMMKYLDTDLICYRCDAPADLATQMAKARDPYIKWFKDSHKADIKITTGLSAITQSSHVHELCRSMIGKLNNDQLTVAQLLTASSGSLLMGLAFTHGFDDIDQFFNACFVEELFQGALYEEERYGIDPMQEKQRNNLKRDLKAAKIFLSN